MAAQKNLESFNIRPQEVVDAVQQLTGAAREARLAELAQGLPARTELFKQLAQKYDAMQAAHAKQQADLEAVASNDYDALKAKIDSTNVKPDQLEVLLEKSVPVRVQQLAELKQANSALPARVKAIDQFVTAFDAYHSLKGSIDDAAELKHDLQGSGVLEFHIAVTDPYTELGPAEYDRMKEQLQKKGPRPQAGDQVAWFQLDRAENDKSGQTVMFNDKPYVLCWITPEKSMVNGPGLPRWAMEKATIQQDPSGGQVVAFQLDATGGKLFQDFTQRI